jgi:Family of unknown function (DUF6510)
MNGDDRLASEQQSAEERAGEAMRLDGNAAAGILSEIFVPDITMARATCANCGTMRAFGALPLYGQSMGAVIRCPTCDGVVLRVARTPTGLWLDPRGASLLVMAGSTAPSVA